MAATCTPRPRAWLACNKQYTLMQSHEAGSHANNCICNCRLPASVTHNRQRSGDKHWVLRTAATHRQQRSCNKHWLVQTQLQGSYLTQRQCCAADAGCCCHHLSASTRKARIIHLRGHTAQAEVIPGGCTIPNRQCKDLTALYVHFFAIWQGRVQTRVLHYGTAAVRCRRLNARYMVEKP
jgi:hypothetical protein